MHWGGGGQPQRERDDTNLLFGQFSQKLHGNKENWAEWGHSCTNLNPSMVRRGVPHFLICYTMMPPSIKSSDHVPTRTQKHVVAML